MIPHLSRAIRTHIPRHAKKTAAATIESCCATCHVYVDEAWLSKLPPMRDDEESALDQAVAEVRPSRLSCQILMTEDLDGLAVEVAPGQD